MKNLRFIFPIFLLGLFLAGCSYDEGPLPGDAEPFAQEESALKGAKRNAIPFKSSFEAMADEVDNPPDDGFYHQIVWGDGSSTRLDLVSFLIPDEVIDMTNPENCLAEAEGELVTSSGDKIFFRYSSEFDVTTWGVSTIYVRGMGPITGGTGEYDGVSGHVIYRGEWGPTDLNICKFQGVVNFKGRK